MCKKVSLIRVIALLVGLIAVTVAQAGNNRPESPPGLSVGHNGSNDIPGVAVGHNGPGSIPGVATGHNRPESTHGTPGGPTGPAGMSHVGHLYLFEKDPETWEIIEGGAWGKMRYNILDSTFKYVFNGHGLEPDWEYTLLYYPDPWPGNGLICLGSAIADEDGNVHIENMQQGLDTGSLPAEGDENYPTGAKIWLVLSDDVDCNNEEMIAWNPTEYLFEYNLITFGDVNNEVPMNPTVYPAGPTGPAGGSHVGHLYLFEKDSETWDVVEDAAWAKMKYNLWGSTFDYVFNGHGLAPAMDYTLIYYPDPWPGEGLICLGFGSANEDGDVHIMGSVNTSDLPVEEDENYPGGAKIWLVLSDDVDCNNEEMIGWNPAEYLFEWDLIRFNDIDE